MPFRRTAAATMLALTSLMSAPWPAAAQSGMAVPQGLEGVALIEGWRRADGTHVAALEIRMAPGWHTYWRAPGEGGIPPVFDWSGSANLAGVAYEWPTPLVFDTYGMPTIGYEGALVLPLMMRPKDPEAPIDAELELFFGVCKEICVPAGAQVSARLAPGAVPQGRARIERALAQRARTAAEAGVTEVACRIEPSDSGYELTAALTFAAAPGPDHVAVVEPGHAGLWVAMPETRTEGRQLIARARVEPIEPGAWIDRQRLRVTVLGDGTAIDVRGCSEM